MADKKLLEESVIARFQQLANIPKTSKGMLSEGVRVANARADRSYAGVTKEESKDTLGGMMREEEEMPADDAGMDAMAGDDMGADAEGGDLESAVSTVVDALNGLLDAAGLSDKKVEMDSGEEGGEGMEAPEADAGGEEEMPMMESDDADSDDEDKMEEAADPDEELDESIELVDDTLIEKLVQRVSARLVAEARKTRELAEGKKGSSGNWLAKPKHSSPPKHKGSPKGKTGTPFTKSVSVKGLAGRGK